MSSIVVYPEALKQLIAAEKPWTGWVNASIKAMLLDQTYVPADTHATKDHIFGELGTSGSYPTGGALLVSKTLTVNANQVRMDAADLNFIFAAPRNPRWVVVYDATNPLQADQILLCRGDLGIYTPRTTRSIIWPANGVIVLTVPTTG